MTGTEYGVEWASAVDSFVAAGYTASGAASMVEKCGDPRKHSPHAVRVMRRDIGPWEAADPKASS